MNELMLLTRDGCINTPTMRQHLDQALQTLGQSVSCTVVDQGTLAEGDARRGYPTPTLLYAGTDVFGMAALAPPFRKPS